MAKAGDDSIRAVMLYATLNSPGLHKFLKAEFVDHKLTGETMTLYEKMSFENIVLRLMDNRDFNALSENEKASMVYTDYYPESARTDERVFMDDRWNLCQELHNKLCAELHIPETLVKIVNFKETEMDDDLFEHYDPFSGIIYLNSEIKYHNCSETELVERVMHATYMHKLYCELRRNFGNLSAVDGKYRYLLCSCLNKLVALSSLTDENLPGVRREMEYNDGFSAGMLYAVFSAYNRLNKMFTEHNLYSYPGLQKYLTTFKLDRESFMSRITDEIGQENEDEDDDEDLTELDGYDELDEFEKELLEPEVEEGLLYSCAGYDMDILHIIDTSVLNEQIGKTMFPILLNEMDGCARDFYAFFGSKVTTPFKEQYEEYMSELDESGDEEEFDEDEFE